MRAAWLSIVVALASCSFQATDAGGGGGGGGGGPEAGTTDGPSGHDAPTDGTATKDAPGIAAITFEQGSSFTKQTQPVDVDLTHATTTDNLIVVMVGWTNGNALSTLTDDGSNAYLPLPFLGTHNALTEVAFYACGSHSATHVHATFGVLDAAQQDYDVRVVEYSGIQTTACLDTQSNNTGSGTTMDSGSLTTSGNNELLVATTMCAGSAALIDPSYQLRLRTVFGNLVEDRVLAAPGTDDPTATQTFSSGAPSDWIMQAFAFKGN
jgi:hypothetical protein